MWKIWTQSVQSRSKMSKTVKKVCTKWHLPFNLIKNGKRNFEDFAQSLLSFLALHEKKEEKEKQEWTLSKILVIAIAIFHHFKGQRSFGADFFDSFAHFRPWLDRMSSNFSHLWTSLEIKTTFMGPTLTHDKCKNVKLDYTSCFCPFWACFRHTFNFLVSSLVAEISAVLQRQPYSLSQEDMRQRRTQL